MTLICQKEDRERLLQKLKPFQHLELTLIEKKASCSEVGIQFDQADLEELIRFLNHHFIQEKKRTINGLVAGRIRLIPLNEVLYIEGMQRETFAYTSSLTIQLNQKLYQLEEALYPDQFIRISKSYLVNLMKVEQIEPSYHGRLTLILENGLQLEVSRSYAKHFKQAIGLEKKR